MEPAATRRLLTAEEFMYEPPDDLRSELVAGEVVKEPPPGPEHEWLAGTVAYHLRRFLEEHRLGRVLGASGYVLKRGPDTVRGPDESFVSEERWSGKLDRRRYFEGAPDLAVEVASPEDSRPKLRQKAREYLAAGARLVWVVWPQRRTVDVHRPGSPPETLTLSDTLDGGDVLPGFALPVARIFEE
jgi:Uma2 family endonuclease